MPNSYTKIHIQFVFAVKYRAALIDDAWRESLHQYITGIFRENDHKMLQVNSMPDHIHIFIGMRPHQSVSSLMQNVKTESSKWIKRRDQRPIFRVARRLWCFFLCEKPSRRCNTLYSKPTITS